MQDAMSLVNEVMRFSLLKASAILAEKMCASGDGPIRLTWADGWLPLTSVSDVLRTPVPGQEVADALDRTIPQPGQHISEPSLWIDVVDLGGGNNCVDRSRTPAALIGAGEGPVSSSYGDRP
jgi:hypothetical protein